MKYRKWILLWIATLGLSCGTSTQKSLDGHWYTRQNDNNYFELYIKENQIIMNHAAYGLEEYSFLKKDSVLYVTNDAFERIWVIEALENDHFKIRDNRDTMVFKKLTLGVNFFEVSNDSSSLRQFIDDFKLRVKLNP
jgi:hypothetical protein